MNDEAASAFEEGKFRWRLRRRLRNLCGGDGLGAEWYSNGNEGGETNFDTYSSTPFLYLIAAASVALKLKQVAAWRKREC